MVPISDSEKKQIVQQFDTIYHHEPDFFEYLNHHGLHQLWRQFLDGAECSDALRAQLNQLKSDAFNSAAKVLKEEDQLRKLVTLFENSHIPTFVFKGGQFRRTLYADPTLRPVSDIDLFVGENRRFDAARLLTELGFELSANAATVSHEASFIKNRLCIDLHWHLARPGRTRIDLSPFLLENRMLFADGLWGLNPAASLLVMLIHPAFTKHLSSPDSMLIHMVDLNRLLHQAKDDWSEVKWMLELSGTKTAAWSSLKLLHFLSGQEFVAEFSRELQPGLLHKRYLELWIEQDLVRRWFGYRNLVRLAFNLALQDTVTDALRSVRYLFRARYSAHQQIDNLYRAVDPR